MPSPTPKQRMAGIATVLILVWTGYIGSLFLMGPILPLIFIAPELFLRVTGGLQWVWLTFVCALIEVLNGTKIVVSGDPLPLNSSGLIIANHRTRLDWFFLWTFVLRKMRLEHEKIVLKDSLRNVPGFGWAMQCFCFLFISRAWATDESVMKDKIDYFGDLKFPIQLLIFPEGTDLSPSNVEKSHAFAEKTGLAKYDYVLHPRVKGFEHCVRCLRSTSDSIYDITIAYPDVVPENEACLLHGQLPKEIHFLVRRYDIRTMQRVKCVEDVSASDAELPDASEVSEWCKQRWAEKEDTLKRFYENDQGERKLNDGLPRLSDVSEEEDQNAAGMDEFGVKSCFRIAIIFWVFFFLLSATALWQFPLVRWYAVFANVAWVVVTLCGGADAMQMKHIPRGKSHAT
eukprot:TRINITY_DN614_c1_g1_i1.p1 TRINITY_DN614_c1_g1~~TRINITY_DN614_c1_g1_i1.p1  ORF type:complete len:400 (-),score=71.08 TRINITY_DN614_c1_g1_i1:29-1228(-)